MQGRQKLTFEQEYGFLEFPLRPYDDPQARQILPGLAASVPGEDSKGVQGSKCIPYFFKICPEPTNHCFTSFLDHFVGKQSTFLIFLMKSAVTSSGCQGSREESAADRVIIP